MCDSTYLPFLLFLFLPPFLLSPPLSFLLFFLFLFSISPPFLLLLPSYLSRIICFSLLLLYILHLPSFSPSLPSLLCPYSFLAILLLLLPLFYFLPVLFYPFRTLLVLFLIPLSSFLPLLSCLEKKVFCPLSFCLSVPVLPWMPVVLLYVVYSHGNRSLHSINTVLSWKTYLSISGLENQKMVWISIFFPQSFSNILVNV